MIRTVLQLRAKPGQAAALLDVFNQQQVLEHSRAVPGCQSVHIFQDLEDVDLCVVFADWDDPDAYQRWLSNPRRPGMNQALRPLLADIPVGDIVGSRFVRLSTDAQS